MERKIYDAAMYLRLSRDDEDRDGRVKTESNSIGSQRDMVRSFIREQEDIELYDVYVDDGYTGSNFDRPDFKRMIGDIEAGKVNCVIVKDLSRFGRDYIESGRYIQKKFPAQGVRFIAITDNYDSITADTGESSIVLPVKNFINDAYCRDISTKVRSQFEVKRKNGECVAAFAVYGYLKDPADRNHLVVDGYAADIVRRIFSWKVEGMANAAIAKKLNELGILSPKEYKKSIGINYRGGFSNAGTGEWSSVAVKRILTNEVYTGTLVQGKTEKINHKVRKSTSKPENEWIRVENTHEAIISEDQFGVVQNLLGSDGRVSPETEKASPFMGLLYCGDCHEQMIRRVNRYKGKTKVYYICSTKNRGEGCSRHSIEEETLKAVAGETIRKYANAFLEEKELFDATKSLETNFDAVTQYDKEIERLGKEQDKYYSLLSSLYESLKSGVIGKEEFERLHRDFEGKAKEIEAAKKKQESLIKEMFKKGVVSAGKIENFKSCLELRDIDRQTLASLVKRIHVYEDKRIEIEFYHMDMFQAMRDVNENRKEKAGGVPAERSA